MAAGDRVSRMSTRGWIFVTVVALIAVIAVVQAVRSALDGPPAPVEQHTDRVSTSGTSLTLDGDPWWPIGINAYQLGTNWDVNVGCGAEVDLEAYFSALPPRSLTRVAFLSTLAVDKATGGIDFTPLDEVVDTAGRHDQLLVIVLTGHDGACEDSKAKEHPWYAGGWRTDVAPGTPMSFADWLDTAVTRWAGAPSIIGWAPVGEPEPSLCATPDCPWPERTCPADAAQVLRTFFDETGERIRELDPQTTVWNGLVGGPQCGSAGADYDLVNRSPGIDVLEYHDYEPLEVTLPGDPESGLQRRIEQAHAIGKPLVVAEIGADAGSCLPVDTRAAELSESIDAQRAAGTAGALFWAFVPDPRMDQCTYDIGPTDPLMNLIGDREPN